MSQESLQTQSAQSANSVLMVHPDSFESNEETAQTNSFQREISEQDDVSVVRRQAQDEFSGLKSLLEVNGVAVIEHRNPVADRLPDAIYPNNWFSTHTEYGGILVLYPMLAPNRRKERNSELIAKMRSRYAHLVDLTEYEKEGRFLEGTGSLVLDRINRLAFVCSSPRSDPGVVRAWASALGYVAVVFNALDAKDQPCYHTNVVMSIGEKFAIICLDAITNEKEREVIEKLIGDTARELVPITMEQMANFCGNCIELVSSAGQKLLVFSETARLSLGSDQMASLEKYAKIISSPIPTIERHGGGSARCMIAEMY